MDLREQLSQWSSEGRFDEIIQAEGDIPESELDLFTICQLALAYNNTDQLQESIDLLMRVWDIGEENPVWNYYLGYALVFSGRKEEAREYLMRARDIDSKIPAEKILHFCVCHDGEADKPVDDKALAGWVCDMLGGQLEDGSVKLPQMGLSITPWFDELRPGDTCYASAYFRINLENQAQFFECCVGLGETLRDAVTAALGSFYIGIYSALQKMCHKENLLQIKDAQGRAWSVYAGEIVGMGRHPMAPQECYWELLADAIPAYLGSRSPVYMKLYGARNGDEITVECRVDDIVSEALSDRLREPVSAWDTGHFASHKQFFFLVCDEEQQPYPYTQQQMNEFVAQAVELFCKPDLEYNLIAPILAEHLGDQSLASELHAFIPELCAEKAFEKVTSGDEINIMAGDREIRTTKWALTVWWMIDEALGHGFGNKLFPETAFKDCVSASSTWNVICQAQEKGHNLMETGGTVQRYYNFEAGYTPR